MPKLQNDSLTRTGKAASNNRISIALSKHDLEEIHEKDTETEKLQQIWVFCESQRQMHKLAHEYFASRDFYFNFLPIVILTFVAGALSLFITTNIVEEPGKTYLGIAVGLVSVLSVAVQSVAKESSYSARAELHRNAALGMKTLKDEIDFQLVDPGMEVNPTLANAEIHTIDEDEETGADKSDKKEKEEEANVEIEEKKETTVETYRRISMQILDSCKSVVPIRIAQPFLLVDSRLTLELSDKTMKEKLYRKHGRMAEQLLAASWYNELFVQISNSRAWPMIVPHPDSVVDRAKGEVVQTFIEQSPFLQNVI